MATSAAAPLDPQSFVATDPGGSWILASAPEGFEPVLAMEDGGRREIFYQRRDALGDLFDSPIRVIVVDTDVDHGVEYQGATTNDVNGHAATAYEMHSDGQFFGRAVTWRDELGRIVTIEWSDVDRDVLALARTAIAVSAADWSLWKRALSIDTKIGKANGDSTEIVLLDEQAGGDTYRFVALVPADYPLTDPDQRQTCYRLDLNNNPGIARCDTHPWWDRTAEHAFVYGPAADGVSDVAVQRVGPDQEPTTDQPITAHVATPGGPPGGFYVSVLPADWCFVTVTASDGSADPNLGAIGPLPMHPDHAACLSAG